jgi:peptidoglycan hydrolase CwlO-like protein
MKLFAKLLFIFLLGSLVTYNTSFAMDLPEEEIVETNEEDVPEGTEEEEEEEEESEELEEEEEEEEVEKEEAEPEEEVEAGPVSPSKPTVSPKPRRAEPRRAEPRRAEPRRAEPRGRQLKLSEKKAPMIRGEIKVRKALFKQANMLYEKILTDVKEIENITDRSSQISQNISTQVGPFYNKINVLLGKFEEIGDQIKDKLEKLKPTKAEPLDRLNNFEEESRELKTNIEEMEGDKDTLNEFLEIIIKDRADASKEVAAIAQIIPKILSVKTDTQANAEFNNVVKAQGRIEETLENVREMKQNIESYAGKIKKSVASISKRGKSLQTQATKLMASVPVPPHKTKPLPPRSSRVPAVASAKEGVSRDTPKIELQWYEKIVASVATSIIKIRNFIRFIFGIKPKKEHTEKKKEKIQKKTTEIEADKAKLESKMSLLENVFYSTGHFINRMLERAAQLGRKSKGATRHA